MSFPLNNKKPFILDGFLQLKPNLSIFTESNNIICADNDLFSANPAKIEKCGICLSKMRNPLRPINCFHYFCKFCILKWYNCGNTTCPICRKNFSMLAPKNFDEMRKDIKNTFYYKSKQYQMMQRFKKNTEKKILCDLCQTGDKEENLLICTCCKLFYCHYFCDLQLYITDYGYLCPNCRYIFNLEL